VCVSSTTGRRAFRHDAKAGNYFSTWPEHYSGPGARVKPPKGGDTAEEIGGMRTGLKNALRDELAPQCGAESGGEEAEDDEGSEGAEDGVEAEIGSAFHGVPFGLRNQ
jgi:hypothetical protein